MCSCSEGWTGQLCEVRCPESCGSGTCSHAQVGLRWVNGTAEEDTAVGTEATGDSPVSDAPPDAEGDINQPLEDGEVEGGGTAEAAYGRRLAEEGTGEGLGGAEADEETGTGGGAVPDEAGGGAFCVCFAGAAGDFCDKVEVAGADEGAGGGGRRRGRRSPRGGGRGAAR